MLYDPPYRFHSSSQDASQRVDVGDDGGGGVMSQVYAPIQQAIEAGSCPCGLYLQDEDVTIQARLGIQIAALFENDDVANIHERRSGKSPHRTERRL